MIAIRVRSAALLPAAEGGTSVAGLRLLNEDCNITYALERSYYFVQVNQITGFFTTQSPS